MAKILNISISIILKANHLAIISAYLNPPSVISPARYSLTYLF